MLRRPFMVAGLVFVAGLLLHYCSASYVVDPGSMKGSRDLSPNVVSSISEFVFDSAQFAGSCLGFDDLPAAMTGSVILSMVLPVFILSYAAIAKKHLAIRFNIRHLLIFIALLSLPFILMANIGLQSAAVITITVIVICGVTYRCVHKWESFSNPQRFLASIWTAILLVLTVVIAGLLWLSDGV